MKPELVCEILVHAQDGKKRRGSGYPITPNRVITAAHVVADAVSVEGGQPGRDGRRIELRFGSQDEPVHTPVSIEWSGESIGLDVAVLRCELPDALCPTHRLLPAPPDTPIKWFSQGYTAYARSHFDDGKDDYDGELPKFSVADSKVEIRAQNGPIDSSEWRGGSGSVLFDRETAQMALAVITRFEGGKQLDQLIAVPICYLLNSDDTKERFRRAIRFEAYQKGEYHRARVTETIVSKLVELGEAPLSQVMQAICELVGEAKSGIERDGSTLEKLANQVANCLVSYESVTDIVGCLVGLVREIEPEGAKRLLDIIDHLLPLNYAPHVLHRLYEQIGDGGGQLVEDEVATRALAEIIMAGYDQKPAHYVTPADDQKELRGKVALDYIGGPEEGPSDDGADETVFLQSVRNVLADLLALKDQALNLQSPSSTLNRESEGHAVALKQEIKNDAVQLQGALKALSNMSNRRTIYCVLRMPQEPPQRVSCKRLLSHVGKDLPNLVFVELVRVYKDDREFEVEAYIQARLVPPV